MFKQVGVIGGGMIGASMAALFAGNGIRVVLLERAPSRGKGAGNCRHIYEDLIAKKLVTPSQAEIALSYISYTSDYAWLSEMEFVYECIYEQTAAKHEVYAQLERHCPKLRVIASSTSAISADELAEGFTRDLCAALWWLPIHGIRLTWRPVLKL